MLELLDGGSRIINVDQSWLNQLDFRRRKWTLPGYRNSMPVKAVSPRLSVIAAIDTEGEAYMALSMANTDSATICLFLRQLVQHLELERPGFREDTVIQLDGASYHLSDETRNYLANVGVKVVIGGPYGFQTAPIEHFFAALKSVELNPGSVSTGKR